MAYIYHESNANGGGMSLADKQNNANEIYNQLSGYGWTLNAICGFLGNVERESYINPAQWQIGYTIGTTSGGFGLVQWTPSTKYTNWATSNGYDIYDGYWQVHCVDKQSYGTEWLQTSDFPITYETFKKSNESIAYLTECFLKNYERAGVSALQDRINKANYWYNFLSGLEPPDPDPDPDPDPTEGDLYDKILETSYNTNRLTQEEIDRIKLISVGDDVKMIHTYDKNKKILGTTYLGQRVRQDDKLYQIMGVRTNGNIILKHGLDNVCLKYINPKYIIKENENNDET